MQFSDPYLQSSYNLLVEEARALTRAEFARLHRDFLVLQRARPDRQPNSLVDSVLTFQPRPDSKALEQPGFVVGREGGRLTTTVTPELRDVIFELRPGIARLYREVVRPSEPRVLQGEMETDARIEECLNDDFTDPQKPRPWEDIGEDEETGASAEPQLDYARLRSPYDLISESDFWGLVLCAASRTKDLAGRDGRKSTETKLLIGTLSTDDSIKIVENLLQELRMQLNLERHKAFLTLFQPRAVHRDLLRSGARHTSFRYVGEEEADPTVAAATAVSAAESAPTTSATSAVEAAGGPPPLIDTLSRMLYDTPTGSILPYLTVCEAEVIPSMDRVLEARRWAEGESGKRAASGNDTAKRHHDPRSSEATCASSDFPLLPEYFYDDDLPYGNSCDFSDCYGTSTGFLLARDINLYSLLVMERIYGASPWDLVSRDVTDGHGRGRNPDDCIGVGALLPHESPAEREENAENGGIETEQIRIKQEDEDGLPSYEFGEERPEVASGKAAEAPDVYVALRDAWIEGEKRPPASSGKGMRDDAVAQNPKEAEASPPEPEDQEAVPSEGLEKREPREQFQGLRPPEGGTTQARGVPSPAASLPATATAQAMPSAPHTTPASVPSPSPVPSPPPPSTLQQPRPEPEPPLTPRTSLSALQSSLGAPAALPKGLTALGAGGAVFPGIPSIASMPGASGVSGVSGASGVAGAHGVPGVPGRLTTLPTLPTLGTPATSALPAQPTQSAAPPLQSLPATQSTSGLPSVAGASLSVPKETLGPSTSLSSLGSLGSVGSLGSLGSFGSLGSLNPLGTLGGLGAFRPPGAPGPLGPGPRLPPQPSQLTATGTAHLPSVPSTSSLSTMSTLPRPGTGLSLSRLPSISSLPGLPVTPAMSAVSGSVGMKLPPSVRAQASTEDWRLFLKAASSEGFAKKVSGEVRNAVERLEGPGDYLEELYPPRTSNKPLVPGKPGEEDSAAAIRANVFTQIIDLGKYLYCLLYDDLYAELRDDRELFAARITDLWDAMNDVGWAFQTIQAVSKGLVEFWEQLQADVSRVRRELGVS